MSSAFRTSSSSFVAFVSLLLFILVPNLGVCEQAVTLEVNNNNNSTAAAITTTANNVTTTTPTSHLAAAPDQVGGGDNFPPPLPKSLSPIITKVIGDNDTTTTNNSGKPVDDDDNFDFDHNQTHPANNYLQDFMPDYVNILLLLNWIRLRLDY